MNRLARAAHSHYSRRCRHVSKAPRTEIAPSLFDHGGLNKALGYDTPANVIYKYPHVYWSNVAPQIKRRYRSSMSEEWGIANLLQRRFQG